MTGFVNRKEELSRLRELYESDKPELAVIYGRRRLGKTELIKKSVENYDDVVVYQAREKTASLQLQQFIEQASEVHPGVEQLREDWELVLQYLADRDTIVVLDEFPYLVEQDQSLPSVIQAMFDHELDESEATIVLIGSSISMMEEAALLGNSPLYGRSSLKLDIRQLPFGAAMEFFDDAYSPEEQVLAWGVFGGVPYYLEEVSPEATLGENIQKIVLSRHGSLHNEPDYVLRMELKEPTRYFSIMEAIAGGNVSRNEIAGETGIEYNQLSKYLNRLSRLRLIDNQVPVTEQKERSKRGRYYLRDQFFRFWFNFMYGDESRYDELGERAYTEVIEPEMADFVSQPFEDLCRFSLRTFYPEYTVTKVGRWWYDEHEIDVVGLTDERTLIAGECRFQESPVGYDVFSKLQNHTDELRWNPQQGDRKEEYAVFSRSGFEKSVEEAAEKRDDLRLFTVDDVVETLRNS